MSLDDLAVVLSLIAAIVSPWIVAGVIRWSHNRQYNITIKQLERQADIDSARLVVEIDKEFRTKGFRDIHELVRAGEVDVTKGEHQVWLDRYLDYLMMVYQFRNDGLIAEKHINTFYDGYFDVFIEKNKPVCEYIEKYKEELDYLYERLQFIKKGRH